MSMYLRSSYSIEHVNFQQKYSETGQRQEKIKSQETKQSSEPDSHTVQLLELSENEFKISVYNVKGPNEHNKLLKLYNKKISIQFKVLEQAGDPHQSKCKGGK